LSGKCRALLLVAALTVAMVLPAMLHYWSEWSRSPVRAVIWLGEVVGIIALALILAPILLRALRALAWVYLAVGGLLARLILVTLAVISREQGGQAVFMDKRLLPTLSGWMRFGADEETVERSLAPELLAGWIVAAWPVVVLPLVLEETAPLLLVLLGVAPFICRHHRHRTIEVKNAVLRALENRDPLRAPAGP